MNGSSPGAMLMRPDLWARSEKSREKKIKELKYPDNRDFIFTIFDDTDVSTLEYIKPIYDCLGALNIKVTKSVWPLGHEGESDYKGSATLEDGEYARFIRVLHDNGFEIGFHGASMVSSTRDEIEMAFKVFNDVIGSYPRIYAPHASNRDNLYWGGTRLTNPLFRKLYQVIWGGTRDHYQGHQEGSPFFWGDLAFKHIDYVRNFTFWGINLLNISKCLPYSNEKQPWVKSWFFTSDADNVEEFNGLLSKKNQEKLEKERGVLIISTHFGKGFVRKGRIHEETEKLLLQIRKRNGWFVPVSTALDFLKGQQGISTVGTIENTELIKIELKWFLHCIIRRMRRKRYVKTEIDYLVSNKRSGKHNGP